MRLGLSIFQLTIAATISLFGPRLSWRPLSFPSIKLLARLFSRPSEIRGARWIATEAIREFAAVVILVPEVEGSEND